MNVAVPLAAGLLLGRITAPLVRALARKRPRRGGGAGARAPAAAPDAAPGPAAPATATPPATAAPAAASPSSSSASSTATTTTTNPPPKQNPSLEHARATAGTAKPPPCPPFANGNGPAPNAPALNAEPDAEPAPTLDLSTPQAIAALFANGGLQPLVPSHDGRPLVAFDLEATGLSVTRDRVVEIAAVKVWPDGRVEVKGPQRLNPGREAALRMPAQVVEIHGLTPAMLAKEPRWEDVAGEWREFLKNCDLAGYNSLRYDVPLLRAEFKRAGDPNFPPHGVRVLDGFRVFSRMAPRSLPAAVRVFCGGVAMQGHHSALADAAAALAVLRGQLAAYPGLPRDAGELAQWCASPDDPGRQLTWCGRIVWDDGASTRELEAFAAAAEAHAAAASAARGPDAAPLQLPPPPPPPQEATAVFAFGKHRDVPLKVVAEEDREYLLWLIARREALSEEAAAIVAAALRGEFPRKGPGFGAWLEKAMARLAPTAGGGGVISAAAAAAAGAAAGPSGVGTEAAEVARMTGVAAPVVAAPAVVAAGADAATAEAATAATDAAADATAPFLLPPPPLGPAAPELPPVALLGTPSTMCHLPGDFEREAPAAGNYHASTARYGRNRRSGGGRRRRGGGGAGAAATAGDGDDGEEGGVRSVGVQVPEPVVRGWDEARKAYLGDGEEQGGGKAGGGGGASEPPVLPPPAAASSSSPPPAAAEALVAAATTTTPPVSLPPPPAFLGADSWASSPRAGNASSSSAAAVPPAPPSAADDVTTPDPPSPPPALALAAAGPGPSGSAGPPIEQASLDWGRYKGRPLAEVAAEDPAFVRWVVECLGASPWDRAAAAAALRAAGEDDGAATPSGHGSEDDDEEEEEAAEEEQEAEEQQRQAAASE